MSKHSITHSVIAFFIGAILFLAYGANLIGYTQQVENPWISFAIFFSAVIVAFSFYPIFISDIMRLKLKEKEWLELSLSTAAASLLLAIFSIFAYFQYSTDIKSHVSTSDTERFCGYVRADINGTHENIFTDKNESNIAP